VVEEELPTRLGQVAVEVGALVLNQPTRVVVLIQKATEVT
jgi:hypothetical protein